MKRLLCLMLPICFIFTACTKTEPVMPETKAIEISASKTTLSLSGKVAGTDSLTIESNSKWTLVLPSNTASWLKTSVASGGIGATKVYITMLQPNKTGATRSASLLITSEADPLKVQSIQVTQQTYTIEGWNKLYGGTRKDIYDAMLPTADSGYIMVGGAESSDGDAMQNKGGFDAWIVKVNQDGAIAWQKSYGGSEYDRIFSVINSRSGGYMLAGVSYSSDGDLTHPHRGNGDVWLMEIDANGNKLWQKTYGGSGSEYPFSMVSSPDGGYIIQASSWSSDGDISHPMSSIPNQYDWWIFKIDATGNKAWDRNFGGSALDIASNIIAVSGGYLITGATRSADFDAVGNHGDYDALIIKIDESGNKIWSHVFGGTASDGLVGATQTQDGSFMFTGHASSMDGDVSQNKGQSDVWVVKTDGSGTMVWEKTFGGAGLDDPRGVIETSTGEYLIVGSTNSSNGDVTTSRGSYDGWVLAFNATGNKLWQKSFGGAANDFPNAIQQGADGYYILVGSTDSNDGDCQGSHGSTEAWAVKFNSP